VPEACGIGVTQFTFGSKAKLSHPCCVGSRRRFGFDSCCVGMIGCRPRNISKRSNRCNAACIGNASITLHKRLHSSKWNTFGFRLTL
jgi:hypothetical protein